MYTCLIYEQIIKNVRIAIEWAKEYAHQPNSTDGRRHYNAASGLAPTEWIMQHVEFVVKNTFFYNGKVVRHQEIGLPMGTNSAQELANLTLHVDEAIFIDSLIKAKQIEEAKQHSDNFRLIDDILTWDIEPPTCDHYGLEWNETTLPDGSVIYLGGKISKINGRLDISIFDKAAEWPF